MDENTDNAMPGFLPPLTPGHPSVQTVGAAFSTITGEAPPAFRETEGQSYYQCRAAPALCPEHQVTRETSHIGWLKAKGYAISAGAVKEQCQEDTQPSECSSSALLIVADVSNQNSRTFPPFDNSLLPLLDKFVEFLVSVSKERAERREKS